MKSGQRDLHDNPLKRRLSISYEELENLHESIKASVLKELRAEMGKNPAQKPLNSNYLNQKPLSLQTLKDSIISEIRTELIEGGSLSNSLSLKNSILNELHMELEKPSGTDQKLKEMKLFNDGLLRELLDQKTVVKKLEEQVQQLSVKFKNVSAKVSAVQPPLLDDSLVLPPLSRKPGHGGNIKKKAALGRERVEVREVPAPLPGSSSKVKLKIEDEFPESGIVKKPETKCEYIIAESGELRARDVPKGNSGRPENRKCEFIVAEHPSRPARTNETIVSRDDEDVEIVTCKRKILNTQ